MDDKIEAIRERIVKPKYPNITISRVPVKTSEQFRTLASEFCEDYGMTLKFLIDFYFGLIPTGLESIEEEIQQLRAKVLYLEEQIKEKKEEKPVRRSIDGSIRQ